MRTYQILTNALAAFAMLFNLGLSTAHSQNVTSYPKMAPLEQYMMERDAEIALARSAAPEGISKDATVLVLTRQGFETAVTGKSGWTCYVDRSWAGMLDHPEFWNPQIRAAACLNSAASRSFIPYERLRAKLILGGKSKQDIVVTTAAAIEKRELPKLEPGGMCYMMSKTNYLTDEGDHAMPHVMFYTADKGEALGANLPHSPFMGGSYWSLSPDAFPQLKDFPPIYISIMMADQWADGTPSTKMKM